MENYEYKYQGRDAVPDIIEAGEYVVEVIEAVLGVSNGAKTAGSRTWNPEPRSGKLSRNIHQLTFGLIHSFDARESRRNSINRSL